MVMIERFGVDRFAGRIDLEEAPISGGQVGRPRGQISQQIQISPREIDIVSKIPAHGPENGV